MRIGALTPVGFHVDVSVVGRKPREPEPPEFGVSRPRTELAWPGIVPQILWTGRERRQTAESVERGLKGWTIPFGLHPDLTPCLQNPSP